MDGVVFNLVSASDAWVAGPWSNGDQYVPTTFATDANGAARFKGLKTGKYILTETVPTGYIQDVDYWMVEIKAGVEDCAGGTGCITPENPNADKKYEVGSVPSAKATLTPVSGGSLGETVAIALATGSDIHAGIREGSWVSTGDCDNDVGTTNTKWENGSVALQIPIVNVKTFVPKITNCDADSGNCYAGAKFAMCEYRPATYPVGASWPSSIFDNDGITTTGDCATQGSTTANNGRSVADDGWGVDTGACDKVTKWITRNDGKLYLDANGNGTLEAGETTEFSTYGFRADTFYRLVELTNPDGYFDPDQYFNIWYNHDDKKVEADRWSSYSSTPIPAGEYDGSLASDELEFTIWNVEKTEFEVTKLDSVTNLPLQNVEFTLTGAQGSSAWAQDTSTYNFTATTDVQGHAIFKNLRVLPSYTYTNDSSHFNDIPTDLQPPANAGYYLINETSTPVGYVSNDTEYRLTIGAGLEDVASPSIGSQTMKQYQIGTAGSTLVPVVSGTVKSPLTLRPSSLAAGPRYISPTTATGGVCTPPVADSECYVNGAISLGADIFNTPMPEIIKRDASVGTLPNLANARFFGFISTDGSSFFPGFNDATDLMLKVPQFSFLTNNDGRLVVEAGATVVNSLGGAQNAGKPYQNTTYEDKFLAQIGAAIKPGDVLRLAEVNSPDSFNRVCFDGKVTPATYEYVDSCTHWDISFTRAADGKLTPTVTYTPINDTFTDFAPTQTLARFESTPRYSYQADNFEEYTVKIIKENALDPTLTIEGATFRLCPGTAPWSDTCPGARIVTSDANGELYFGNLSSGDYRLKEIEAPAGYELNPKVYVLHIGEGIVAGVFQGETLFDGAVPLKKDQSNGGIPASYCTNYQGIIIASADEETCKNLYPRILLDSSGLNVSLQFVPGKGQYVPINANEQDIYSANGTSCTISIDCATADLNGDGVVTDTVVDTLLPVNPKTDPLTAVGQWNSVEVEFEAHVADGIKYRINPRIWDTDRSKCDINDPEWDPTTETCSTEPPEPPVPGRIKFAMCQYDTVQPAPVPGCYGDGTHPDANCTLNFRFENDANGELVLTALTTSGNAMASATSALNWLTANAYKANGDLYTLDDFPGNNMTQRYASAMSLRIPFKQLQLDASKVYRLQEIDADDGYQQADLAENYYDIYVGTGADMIPATSTSMDRYFDEDNLNQAGWLYMVKAPYLAADKDAIISPEHLKTALRLDSVYDPLVTGESGRYEPGSEPPTFDLDIPVQEKFEIAITKRDSVTSGLVTGATFTIAPATATGPAVCDTDPFDSSCTWAAGAVRETKVTGTNGNPIIFGDLPGSRLEPGLYRVAETLIPANYLGPDGTSDASTYYYDIQVLPGLEYSGAPPKMQYNGDSKYRIDGGAVQSFTGVNVMPGVHKIDATDCASNVNGAIRLPLEVKNIPLKPIDARKYFYNGNTNKPLAGAKFYLYAMPEAVSPATNILFNADGEEPGANGIPEGGFKLTPPGTEPTALNTAPYAAFVTDANGELVVDADSTWNQDTSGTLINTSLNTPAIYTYGDFTGTAVTAGTTKLADIKLRADLKYYLFEVQAPEGFEAPCASTLVDYTYCDYYTIRFNSSAVPTVRHFPLAHTYELVGDTYQEIGVTPKSEEPESGGTTIVQPISIEGSSVAGAYGLPNLPLPRTPWVNIDKEFYAGDQPVGGALEPEPTAVPSDTLQGGATFEIRNASVAGSSVVQGTQIANSPATTDASGHLHLQLPGWGSYTIRETKAPQGFLLDPRVFVITVTNVLDGTPTYKVCLLSGSTTTDCSGDEDMDMDDPLNYSMTLTPEDDKLFRINADKYDRYGPGSMTAAKFTLLDLTAYNADTAFSADKHIIPAADAATYDSSTGYFGIRYGCDGVVDGSGLAQNVCSTNPTPLSIASFAGKAYRYDFNVNSGGILVQAALSNLGAAGTPLSQLNLNTTHRYALVETQRPSPAYKWFDGYFLINYTQTSPEGVRVYRYDGAGTEVTVALPGTPINLSDALAHANNENYSACDRGTGANCIPPSGDITVYNSKPFDLKLTKTDKAGNKLPNARFALVSGLGAGAPDYTHIDADCGDWSASPLNVTGTPPLNQNGQVDGCNEADTGYTYMARTSDAQGVVTFPNLEVGTYYLAEIAAPDGGYAMDPTIRTIVIHEAPTLAGDINSAIEVVPETVPPTVTTNPAGNNNYLIQMGSIPNQRLFDINVRKAAVNADGNLISEVGETQPKVTASFVMADITNMTTNEQIDNAFTNALTSDSVQVNGRKLFINVDFVDGFYVKGLDVTRRYAYREVAVDAAYSATYDRTNATFVVQFGTAAATRAELRRYADATPGWANVFGNTFSTVSELNGQYSAQIPTSTYKAGTRHYWMPAGSNNDSRGNPEKYAKDTFYVPNSEKVPGLQVKKVDVQGNALNGAIFQLRKLTLATNPVEGANALVRDPAVPDRTATTGQRCDGSAGGSGVDGAIIPGIACWSHIREGYYLLWEVGIPEGYRKVDGQDIILHVDANGGYSIKKWLGTATTDGNSFTPSSPLGAIDVCKAVSAPLCTNEDAKYNPEIANGGINNLTVVNKQFYKLTVYKYGVYSPSGELSNPLTWGASDVNLSAKFKITEFTRNTTGTACTLSPNGGVPALAPPAGTAAPANCSLGATTDSDTISTTAGTPEIYALNLDPLNVYKIWEDTPPNGYEQDYGYYVVHFVSTGTDFEAVITYYASATATGVVVGRAQNVTGSVPAGDKCAGQSGSRVASGWRTCSVQANGVGSVKGEYRLYVPNKAVPFEIDWQKLANYTTGHETDGAANLAAGATTPKQFPLAGAKFRLTKSDVNGGGTTPFGEYTSDANGIVSTANPTNGDFEVTPGYYRLHEYEAPAGHIVNLDDYLVRITYDTSEDEYVIQLTRIPCTVTNTWGTTCATFGVPDTANTHQAVFAREGSGNTLKYKLNLSDPSLGLGFNPTYGNGFYEIDPKYYRMQIAKLDASAGYQPIDQCAGGRAHTAPCDSDREAGFTVWDVTGQTGNGVVSDETNPVRPSVLNPSDPNELPTNLDGWVQKLGGYLFNTTHTYRLKETRPPAGYIPLTGFYVLSFTAGVPEVRYYEYGTSSVTLGAGGTKLVDKPSSTVIADPPFGWDNDFLNVDDVTTLNHRYAVEEAAAGATDIAQHGIITLGVPNRPINVNITKVDAESGQPIDVHIDDSDKIAAEFSLTKCPDGTPLANVSIAVCNKDLGTFPSGDGGAVNFGNVKFGARSIYLLHETQAPEGYRDVPPTSYYMLWFDVNYAQSGYDVVTPHLEYYDGDVGDVARVDNTLPESGANPAISDIRGTGTSNVIPFVTVAGLSDPGTKWANDRGFTFVWTAPTATTPGGISIRIPNYAKPFDFNFFKVDEDRGYCPGPNVSRAGATADGGRYPDGVQYPERIPNAQYPVDGRGSIWNSAGSTGCYALDNARFSLWNVPLTGKEMIDSTGNPVINYIPTGDTAPVDETDKAGYAKPAGGGISGRIPVASYDRVMPDKEVYSGRVAMPIVTDENNAFYGHAAPGKMIASSGIDLANPGPDDPLCKPFGGDGGLPGTSSTYDYCHGFVGLDNINPGWYIMQETKSPLEYKHEMTLYLLHFTPGWAANGAEGPTGVRATVRVGHYQVDDGSVPKCDGTPGKVAPYDNCHFPGKIIWGAEQEFSGKQIQYVQNRHTTGAYVLNWHDLLNDKRYVLNIFGNDYDRKQPLDPADPAYDGLDMSLQFVVNQQVCDGPGINCRFEPMETSTSKNSENGWASTDSPVSVPVDKALKEKLYKEVISEYNDMVAQGTMPPPAIDTSTVDFVGMCDSSLVDVSGDTCEQILGTLIAQNDDLAPRHPNVPAGCEGNHCYVFGSDATAPIPDPVTQPDLFAIYEEAVNSGWIDDSNMNADIRQAGERLLAEKAVTQVEDDNGIGFWASMCQSAANQCEALFETVHPNFAEKLYGAASFVKGTVYQVKIHPETLARLHSNGYTTSLSGTSYYSVVVCPTGQYASNVNGTAPHCIAGTRPQAQAVAEGLVKAFGSLDEGLRALVDRTTRPMGSAGFAPLAAGITPYEGVIGSCTQTSANSPDIFFHQSASDVSGVLLFTTDSCGNPIPATIPAQFKFLKVYQEYLWDNFNWTEGASALFGRAVLAVPVYRIPNAPNIWKTILDPTTGQEIKSNEVNVGDEMTYRIHMQAPEEDDAIGTTIIDALPPQVDFISYEQPTGTFDDPDTGQPRQEPVGDVTYDAGSRTLYWIVPGMGQTPHTVPKGVDWYLTVKVRVNSTAAANADIENRIRHTVRPGVCEVDPSTGNINCDSGPDWRCLPNDPACEPQHVDLCYQPDLSDGGLTPPEDPYACKVTSKLKPNLADTGAWIWLIFAAIVAGSLVYVASRRRRNQRKV